MPFENGNQEGRKSRAFDKALRLALNREGEGVRLRNIAEKLVVDAEAGEQWAIKEVADRIDGKVPQGIIGGGEDDPAINAVVELRRTIVRPGT